MYSWHLLGNVAHYIIELSKYGSELSPFHWHKKCTALTRYFLVVVNMNTAKDNSNTGEDWVLTTQESCSYLRITKPTYFKYIRQGRINATKAGKGWKVLKSELDRFLRGDQ
jgi:excisionase family DNA binding protein